MASISACDQGHQHDQQTLGPYIEILHTNFDAATPIASDGVVTVFFDRLLLPITVARQSIYIRTKGGDVAVTPVVSYDPVARSVTLSNPDANGGAWLTDPFYDLVFGIPTPGSDSGGLQSIDGQTLDPTQPLTFQFMTPAALDAGTPTPTVRTTISFCDDVQPLFQNHCSAGQCHGSPAPGSSVLPAAGLVLDTSLGLAMTAIAKPAQGANTGAVAGVPSPPTSVFGIDMPIVDPGDGKVGDPGNSWLLYKLLLAVSPATSFASTRIGCGNPAVTGLDTLAQATAMSDAERTVLDNYVLGREMPYPDQPGVTTRSNGNLPLTLDELERVELWIAQGAHVIDCTCP